MPARKVKKEQPEREEGNQNVSCGSQGGSRSQACDRRWGVGLQREMDGGAVQDTEANGQLSQSDSCMWGSELSGLN